MFGKLGVLAGTMLAMLAVGAPAAMATTTDSCVDFGGSANNCFAGTVEQNVDFATVNMGRNSYGTYNLVCADYNGRIVRFKQGRIGTGGTRTFSVDGLFGFHNPDCVLTAHAIGTPGHNARVRVTLVD